MAGPAIVLFAAFVAIVPLIIRGNACGHDFEYHLVSWLDALHSWQQGIAYPHWASSPLFGAGEPRFVFYPPLSWMLGAALGWLLPWRVVPVVIIWLFLAGTGLATRALARDAMEDGPATLAGCAAIFFGYALFVSYERSAFAELAGGIWIPLLLLFALRDRNPSATVWRRALDGSAVFLAIVLAGAWLSDAPVGVMASYLLAFVALAAALLARSWAPVIRAGAGATLGMGLAGIYLVPAAWEQRWVGIARTITDHGYNIEGNWLFAMHANPAFEPQDWVLLQASLIAVTMIAIALGGVLICLLRRRLPGKLHWWLPLAAIPVVVLCLQFPFSLPVWHLLPKLEYLQFPWRWMLVVEAPMAVFFAAAIWINHRRWRWAVISFCICLFMIDTYGASRFLWAPCFKWSNVASVERRDTLGAIMSDSDQYAPPTADDSLVAMHLPDACLTADPHIAFGQIAPDGTLTWSPAQHTCTATFSAQAIPGKPRTEHFQIHAVTSSPGYLVLRLRTYPAWQVRVNGRAIRSMPQRDDGLMAVPVPRGPALVTVNWIATPDVIVGRWVSVLAFLLLVILAKWERKHSLPRL